MNNRVFSLNLNDEGITDDELITFVNIAEEGINGAFQILRTTSLDEMLSVDYLSDLELNNPKDVVSIFIALAYVNNHISVSEDN